MAPICACIYMKVESYLTLYPLSISSYIQSKRVSNSVIYLNDDNNNNNKHHPGEDRCGSGGGASSGIG